MWGMSNPHERPRFVSIGVLADRLGVPIAWLRAEVDSGRIPFLRAGRRRIFDAESVERTLAQRVKNGADKTKGGRS